MVFFNYALRKLNAKIVYYGPGLCGKTTNLQWIHDHFEGGQRGKMISLATEGDRTIFFDLLPIDIGSIRGMDVTLQLYTVPGQVHYNSTRQLVLRGADGVVFVADSQRTMKSSNVESYENLQENLMLQGIDLKGFPHTLQFNKRDLRDLLSTEDLNESLNVFSVPIFEAVATEGIGVQETLEGIVKLVMRNLREKYEPVASATGPHAPMPMQVTGPTAFKPPEKPAATTPEPLAPDFAAVVKPPAPADQVEDGAPSFEAPVPEPPAPVQPSPVVTQAVGPDSGFAAFQNEDGISTAVYEDQDDEETVVSKPANEGPDFGDKSPVFAPEGDTAADKFEPEKIEEFGGNFTDPRDEDGTDGDKAVAAPADVPTEPDEPEVVDDSPQPQMPDESMEDLFETEVPSVKAFVAQAMGDNEATVESTSEVIGGDTPLNVDLPAAVVDPPVADRYEDRIEAPGPFAPAPTADEPAGSMDEGDVDEEAVRAEVRQALGASEDREALASLSVSEDVEPDRSDEVQEEPAEAQPFVPPTPEEPMPDDTVMVSEEIAPPVFATDEPETVDVVEEAGEEEEPEWKPETIEGQFEAAASDEPTIAEPEVEEAPVEEPIVEEPPFREPVAEELPVEEPVVEEPPSREPVAEELPVEEPVVPEPVAPPPAGADDPLTKSRPVVFGIGEPFAADDLPAVVAEVLPRAEAPIIPASGAINVTAQDNQLHLQLKGSGAIAEIGEVRALDIEVPVPGDWVGNRKVTLQLRLTLTPAEDEDG